MYSNGYYIASLNKISSNDFRKSTVPSFVYRNNVQILQILQDVNIDNKNNIIKKREYHQFATKDYNLLIKNPTACKYWDYEKNLKSPEEYLPNSEQVVWWKCKNCNYEWEEAIKNKNKKINGCPICSDKLSYGNKFVRAFLNQVNEKYIIEHSFKWAFVKHNNRKLHGKKIYDVYLPNRNEIWEIHGLQHYKNGFGEYIDSARTSLEEQENDILKQKLAKQNGYKYIVVDARYSDMEYIKNSLLNISEIKRYDLFKVDWLKCHEYACSSLVKEVCNLWNSGIENTTDIAKILKISSSTIIVYLKQGAELGWCNYKPKRGGRRRKIK